ncbi:Oidioi.mRNA.OKI2018_I69.YSR.g17087.t1.cds [Oikopleura dioica]|uniref:Oidioi.mRNA.OKI2018_I69.YSR.g17087.t1.cds n=1 Tax=Oikopleura dioica TaxID=34765 RepID=A0ABN7SNA7_OIKDI|nr:Oidioi.mRNA.OKI2018_I69.YSR.g17087.t1.cds [Oikopleura dioica]
MITEADLVDRCDINTSALSISQKAAITKAAQIISGKTFMPTKADEQGTILFDLLIEMPAETSQFLADIEQSENLAITINKEMAALYRMCNVNLKPKQAIYNEAELAVLLIDAKGDDEKLVAEFKWLSQILFEIKGENPINCHRHGNLRHGDEGSTHVAARSRVALAIPLDEPCDWYPKGPRGPLRREVTGSLRLDEFLKSRRPPKRNHKAKGDGAGEGLFPDADEMNSRTYVALGFAKIDQAIEKGLDNWAESKSPQPKPEPPRQVVQHRPVITTPTDDDGFEGGYMQHVKRRREMNRKAQMEAELHVFRLDNEKAKAWLGGLKNGEGLPDKRQEVRSLTLYQEEDDKSAPYWSDAQWKQYSVEALQTFQRVIDGDVEPDWNLVRFRSEKDFKCGTFADNVDLWLIFINYLPEKLRPEAYHDIHQGISLFQNLMHVPVKKAKRYKNFKVASYYKTNPDNELKMKSRMKGEDRYRVGKFHYTRQIHYPVFADGDNFGKPLVIKNSKGTNKHIGVIANQIKKWMESAALEYRPPEAKHSILMMANWVVVPKQGEEQWRTCYNGGPLKVLERYTQPCHLDSAGQVLKILKKGDLLSKWDDKSGFHHLTLDPFSRNLAFCQLGGNLFRYRGAAFGLPAIPGHYQLCNGTPVNYLRKQGIRCFLYLDDRLLIVRPSSPAQARNFLNGSKTPRELVAALLLFTLLGTFINRKKSTPRPLQVLEFLGFTINTIDCTIAIPRAKWERFKQEAAAVRKKNVST